MLPNKPSYWLNFHIHGNGTEWLDEGLPTPSYLEHINRGYFVAWQVDGFFGTQKGTEYLNDIIARVLITFKDLRPRRLEFKPKIDGSVHYYPKIYKLRDLGKLNSLKKRIHAPVRSESFKDTIFWAIKLYCEDLIRSQGLATYPQLEEFAFSNFINRKERSTLKAKCRSVFNYYDMKNWKLPKYARKRKTKDDKELLMTRQERALKNTEERAEKARNKVINSVTGLMANTYKKKSGAWHIGMIAKDTGLSEPTVSKYLKELKANGIII